MPELIWKLVEEQTLSSSSLLPSLVLFWWLRSISLIVRCFVFLWHFFFGALCVAILRLLCPSFNEVQCCLATKCGTSGGTFECWFLVTSFDSLMKHANVSFLFCFWAEAIVRRENTFSKIFSNCSWLFFVTIILPCSSFFYTLEESVEVAIAERSKNRSWKFKVEHGQVISNRQSE